MKEADEKFRRRLHGRLLQNAAAMKAVESTLGVSRHLVERFRLGLSEPYPKGAVAGNVVHANVLVAPIMGRDGAFSSRYVYRVLAPITTDCRIDGPVTWCAGRDPLTYFSRKLSAEDSLIVCGTIAEVWALVEMMRGSALESTHVVISSSHGANNWPDEWNIAEFWSRWKRITVSFAVPGPSADPDGLAYDLARHAARDVYRLPPCDAADWTDCLLNGLRGDKLRRAVQSATLISQAEVRRAEAASYGDAASEDISSTYSRGFLFEAIRVRESIATSTGTHERYSVIVIRSDRTRHAAREMPSPSGTPKADRVLRLEPDGCLLRRYPVPSSDSTWRWPSVHAFLYQGATAPPLAELLDRIDGHLRASVWLPHQSDFRLLACSVVVTYCQQIFEAVPLILVSGEKGSGKTELAIAMTELCANSPGPIGLVSAASLVRLSDATHGFVAIDDLEKVMAKRGGDPKFVDIAQTLKLSYKKQSAQKVLTDVSKDNALTRINFFGLKLINNTSGVDEILGSRMLTIATHTMPAGSTLPTDGWLDREQRATLRDALHTWAFCHVDEIARAYVQTSPNKSVRAEEIFAPLRVVAGLSDSEQWRTDVERALGTGRSGDISSADLMKEAILGILNRSITRAKRLRTVLTVTEVKMHMQLLEGGRFGKSSTTEIADIESSVWIGRQFRQVFGRDDAERPRFRMYGHFVRAWAIHPTFLDQAVAQGGVPREELIETDDPQEFCQVCATCDYGALCEIRSSKEPREAPLELRKADRKAVENRAGPDAGLH